MTKGTLILPEDLRIDKVEALKANLNSLLEEHSDYCLDASHVESIDFSGLQLLIAFSLQAKTMQSQLDWQSPSDSLDQAAHLFGVAATLGLANSSDQPNSADTASV